MTKLVNQQNSQGPTDSAPRSGTEPTDGASPRIRMDQISQSRALREGPTRNHGGRPAYLARAHLWAIGYDNLHRARQARDVVNELAGPQPHLILLDTLVVIRSADGSYSMDREPRHTVANIATSAALGALVGWILSVPALAAAVGALLAAAGSAATHLALIDTKFVEEVKALMQPGTSALFVLGDVGDIEAILHRIRGLGGIVLKTDVDLEQLRRVQSALVSEPECRESAGVVASRATAIPRAEGQQWTPRL